MSHAQSECCCVTGVRVLRNKNDVSIFMSLVDVFVQMLLLFFARWSGVYRDVYAIVLTACSPTGYCKPCPAQLTQISYLHSALLFLFTVGQTFLTGIPFLCSNLTSCNVPPEELWSRSKDFCSWVMSWTFTCHGRCNWKNTIWRCSVEFLEMVLSLILTY